MINLLFCIALAAYTNINASTDEKSITEAISNAATQMSAVNTTPPSGDALPAASVATKRDAVHGRIYNPGATFATETNAREAIARGKGDDARTPFVNNVFELVCEIREELRAEGFTATVTRIGPDIYLCCKHTALALQEMTATISPNTIIAIQSLNGNCLTGATGCLIIPHPTADLAIMKLTFANGTLPACELLTLAQPLDAQETTGNGFVVSTGNVSVAGTKQLFLPDHKRVLSIHPFKKSASGELFSEFNGQIAANQVASALSATLSNNIQTLKDIYATAELEFPETSAKASLRLFSTLRDSASGSPLVIKREGEPYKLLGILTRGGFIPKAVANAREYSQQFTAITASDYRSITYRMDFVDLSTRQKWIAEAIATLA